GAAHPRAASWPGGGAGAGGPEPPPAELRGLEEPIEAEVGGAGAGPAAKRRRGLPLLLHAVAAFRGKNLLLEQAPERLPVPFDDRRQPLGIHEGLSSARHPAPARCTRRLPWPWSARRSGRCAAQAGRRESASRTRR